MDLIELHVLQSFPVTCLNRDLNGEPKTAYVGGCIRARVSSQCWKRQIRELCKERSKELFGGIRSRYIKNKLVKMLSDENTNNTDIEKIVDNFFKNKKNKKDDKDKKDVIMFFSDDEIKSMAEAIKNNPELNISDYGKKHKKHEKHNDIADIALFGRMIANNKLSIEGAAMFSHALSTHKTSNDIDFFTAVDDESDNSGSSHMGDIGFNSCCYYRYIGLNVDLLKENLELPDHDFNKVVCEFLKSCLVAVPQAKKNSMFGLSLPFYVLGFRRDGQPLSLFDAFETPIKVGVGGYNDLSKNKLEEHFKHIKEVWGITTKEYRIPDLKVDEFVNNIIEGA